MLDHSAVREIRQAKRETRERCAAINRANADYRLRANAVLIEHAQRTNNASRASVRPIPFELLPAPSSSDREDTSLESFLRANNLTYALDAYRESREHANDKAA